MGQGGYITLVNATNSNWKKTYQHSYQMNSWNFPETIKARSTQTLYVEWDQAIFKHQSDDAGEVNYTLEGTPGLSFQVQARATNGFELKVYFLNIETNGNPKGSTISLGWNHNGYVSFILAGEESDYTSTNLKAASWMQDNLNLLGDKPLKKICLTGSHDSGMSVFTSGTLGAFDCNTLTQSRNIQGQLTLGARYFDIRPVISGGQYYTGHYSHIKNLTWQGANGQSIQSIIADINAFTSNNQELVVLNLSHSLNTDVGNNSYRPFTQSEWDNLFAQLSTLKNLYKVGDDPNIDLTSLTLNKFIQNSSAVVIIVEECVDLDNYQGQGFYLYKNFDVYNSYADTNDLPKMADDQLRKMKQQTGKSYFLLSWTLTQDNTQAATCFLGTASSIKDLANQANQSLPRMLYPSVSSSEFPNIIYTDNIVNSDSAALAMAVNWTLLQVLKPVSVL